MKTICIDGCQVTSRSQAHAYLKTQLQLPDYYGRNLDALYDCLLDIGEQTQLTILHWDVCTTVLGEYAQRLLNVMVQATEENSVLSIIMVPAKENGPEDPSTEE